MSNEEMFLKYFLVILERPVILELLVSLSFVLHEWWFQQVFTHTLVWPVVRRLGWNCITPVGLIIQSIYYLSSPQSMNRFCWYCWIFGDFDDKFNLLIIYTLLSVTKNYFFETKCLLGTTRKVMLPARSNLQPVTKGPIHNLII